VQAFCLKRRKDVLEQVFSDSIFDLFSKPDKNFSRYQTVKKRKRRNLSGIQTQTFFSGEKLYFIIKIMFSSKFDLYLICFVFQNGHSFGKLKATKTTSTASAFGAKTEAKTATSGLVVLQSKMVFHLSLN